MISYLKIWKSLFWPKKKNWPAGAFPRLHPFGGEGGNRTWHPGSKPETRPLGQIRTDQGMRPQTLRTPPHVWSRTPISNPNLDPKPPFPIPIWIPNPPFWVPIWIPNPPFWILIWIPNLQFWIPIWIPNPPFRIKYPAKWKIGFLLKTRFRLGFYLSKPTFQEKPHKKILLIALDSTSQCPKRSPMVPETHRYSWEKIQN